MEIVLYPGMPTQMDYVWTENDMLCLNYTDFAAAP